MLNRLTGNLLAGALVQTLFSSLAFGQGGTAIVPMSKVSYNRQPIVFHIHNRDKKELKIRYEPQCDVDGKEMTGADCARLFSLVFDAPMHGQELVLPPQGSARAEVQLSSSELKYALFKPVFEPLPTDANAKNESVSFQLSYQPGYLFSVRPTHERLNRAVFSSYNTGKFRRAKVVFDVSGLSMPQEVSISAKVFEKKSAKMIRFVRLASDKIFDPRRKVVELEGDFADASYTADVCYQLFVEMKSTNDFYQVNSCLLEDNQKNG